MSHLYPNTWFSGVTFNMKRIISLTVFCLGDKSKDTLVTAHSQRAIHCSAIEYSSNIRDRAERCNTTERDVNLETVNTGEYRIIYRPPVPEFHACEFKADWKQPFITGRPDLR